MKPPADRALGARGANGSATPMMPSQTATIHHRRRTANRPRRSKLMPSAVRDSGAGGWLSLVLPSPGAARRGGQTGTRLRHHGMPDASPAAAGRVRAGSWCAQAPRHAWLVRDTRNGGGLRASRWYKSRRERVSHASGGHVTVAPVGRCRAGQAVVRRSGPSPGPGCRPGDGWPTASWRRSDGYLFEHVAVFLTASTALRAGRPAWRRRGRGRGDRRRWTVPFDGS